MRTFAAVVAAILTLAPTGRTPLVFADSFMDRVIQTLREEAPDLQVESASDDEVRIYTQDAIASLFLYGLQRQCADSPSECDGQIRDFLAYHVDALRNRIEIPFKESKVYPLVRSKQLIDAARRLEGTSDQSTYVYRPFVGGAVIVYAVDSDRLLRFVNPDDLKAAHITLDRLHDLAVANTRRLSPLKFDLVGSAPGVMAATAGDDLVTSRVFDDRMWDDLQRKLGAPAAIATPTRDWILAARFDDAVALANMYDAARRLVGRKTNAILLGLYGREGNRWILLSP
jgi:uncharacterized protein YtpQ (UPF0354 family)